MRHVACSTDVHRICWTPSWPLLGWYLHWHPLSHHHGKCASILAKYPIRSARRGNFRCLQSQKSEHFYVKYGSGFQPLLLYLFLSLPRLIFKPLLDMPETWSLSLCMPPLTGSSPHLRQLIRSTLLKLRCWLVQHLLKLRCCTSQHLPIFLTSLLITSICTLISSHVNLVFSNAEICPASMRVNGDSPGWGGALGIAAHLCSLVSAQVTCLQGHLPWPPCLQCFFTAPSPPLIPHPVTTPYSFLS